MTPEVAIATRNQMLRDGYCLIDDIVTEEFLQELRDETERLIADHEEPADLVYQGQHIGVRGEDNPVIDKLLSWAPSYRALAELGFDDFQPAGSIIILTKEAKGPPLYWHQDWMRWNDPLSTTPWPQTIFLNYYIGHGGILAAACYLTFIVGMRPGPGSWWKISLIGQPLLLAIGLFNWTFGTNYIFLCEPPHVANPLIIGEWPWYVIGMIAMVIAVSFLLYLPFRPRPRKEDPPLHRNG